MFQNTARCSLSFIPTLFFKAMSIYFNKTLLILTYPLLPLLELPFVYKPGPNAPRPE